MIKKFFSYSLIGLINTILGWLIIFYLTYIKLLPELANFIGYIFGILISYFLNKKLNFKTIKTCKNELPKFFLSMFISYLLNLLTLIFFYRYLNFNVYTSQFISNFVYIISGFIFSYFYVFSKEEK